jgi:hypothetical protein
MLADILVRGLPDGDTVARCPCGQPAVLSMDAGIGEVFLCRQHADAFRKRLELVLMVPIPTVPDEQA